MTSLLAETAHDLMVRLSEEEKRKIGKKPIRSAVRSHVSSADVLALMTLKGWDGIRETLEGEGFEGRQLARECKCLLEAIDWLLAAYQRLLAQAEECRLTPETVGLSDLEAKLSALQEARPKVAELLEFASRVPRPVDEALLNESKAAVERGEFVTLDDEYVARLRAGQDL